MKDAVMGMKMKATDEMGRKYMQTTYLKKDYTRLYKELSKLNIKKVIIKRTNDMNRHFIEEDT